MRSSFFSLKAGSLSILWLVLLASCVNKIPSEEDEATHAGDIPIRISASISEANRTRVANNQFEAGDEMGLFVLTASFSLREERHADNVRFVYSDGGFATDVPVYYPKDGSKIRLVSYYPYRKEGMEMGKCVMPVSVSTDQGKTGAHSLSDFLVATKEDVAASNNPVPLKYKHKFFRLKIVLAVAGKDNIDELYDANPKLSVCGFYTEATYDFQNDTLIGRVKERDIVPSGAWKMENGRLVGKELILIPQECNPGYQYVALEVGGKKYTSFLPSTTQARAGKQMELKISFDSSSDMLLSDVEGDIEEWGEGGKESAPSELVHQFVNVSELDFKRSNVYKVFHEKKQVAEICEEYLVTPEFSSPAIVAYPMTAGGKVDLSKGLVVRLIGETAAVHGGTVAWDTDNLSLTYTPGTLKSRDYLYIKADGQFTLSNADADTMLDVLPMADVACDERDGKRHNYPLVKIGTQYWMRENLETPFYTDGTAIPQLTNAISGQSGYVRSKSDHYFYTIDLPLSSRILPERYEIPRKADWDTLMAYLKNDVSLIKGDTWIPNSNGDKVEAATNLTGFSALPVGICMENNSTIKQSGYEGWMVAYWTQDNTRTGMEPFAFALLSNSNERSQARSDEGQKALAIRCIRK
ncbi:MAG: fimbrillin family protein [Mediterranea sp.]|nr:fimbrillin family protein [Mediterranea sp.]